MFGVKMQMFSKHCSDGGALVLCSNKYPYEASAENVLNAGFGCAFSACLVTSLFVGVGTKPHSTQVA